MLPARPVFELTDAPDEASLRAIAEPLTRFNEKCTGVARNHRPLAIFLRGQDGSEIIGGLCGWSYFDMLFVDLLFIPESLRGTGVGTELVAMAEAEAARRKCIGVWLDTFDWQARGFYERLGYSVFGTLDDHPRGHQHFFLVKRLQMAASESK